MNLLILFRMFKCLKYRHIYHRYFSGKYQYIPKKHQYYIVLSDLKNIEEFNLDTKFKVLTVNRQTGEILIGRSH